MEPRPTRTKFPRFDGRSGSPRGDPRRRRTEDQLLPVIRAVRTLPSRTARRGPNPVVSPALVPPNSSSALGDEFGRAVTPCDQVTPPGDVRRVILGFTTTVRTVEVDPEHRRWSRYIAIFVNFPACAVITTFCTRYPDCLIWNGEPAGSTTGYSNFKYSTNHCCR